MTTTYNSKIDSWIPAVVMASVAGCIGGPVIEGDHTAGVILGAVILAIELIIFAGVKYRIKGNMLGARNFLKFSRLPIQ